MDTNLRIYGLTDGEMIIALKAMDYETMCNERRQADNATGGTYDWLLLSSIPIADICKLDIQGKQKNSLLNGEENDYRHNKIKGNGEPS